ncbi:hypothetical protein RS584_03510 [Enterobacter sp. DTU_2021_1002640_1_SI_PRY_ASU_LCPMC_013]|uniref:hypothetical protein n=1 Tax=Enterobacter sp. DTU_2021_1002640_1_SI_PRY_ASU_LCPMC_013 TaxID=3077940 RepID=UPI001A130818|nr:hypothetical protein [Enterobacter sp. DTU_2021_1002640_1_SI_PRY_ASU_LCPMC_013]EGQ5289223.1 hypothetical protein [Enterobacter hormaechei]WNV01193.1 hypothetical protein RS584_03510 [Enterobacter sp. DTU_2021_1002640_1_SI_PRY_ASU_LCPMC_013]
MKKQLFLLLLALLFPAFVSYAWFILTTGHHNYTQDNTFSFWLYTPATLKKLPFISNNSVYSYDYNPDNQQTRVIITWTDINNTLEKKQDLIAFLEMLEGLNKYDCSWLYNDKNDFSDNYQRYCIFQKEKTLELEFFET